MTITFGRRQSPGHPQLDPPGAGDPAPRTGRLGAIVAASLGSGVVGALLATLVFLPGATEHVTTGSVLLAFAAGWAMLALLSVHRTDQPQRWALVPAGCLAVTGILLLLLAPGDGALGAAGWVWPPALASLAAWIVLGARRALHNWSRRWLLYPVCALMALAAVGGSTETLIETINHPTPSAGHRYDVDGHRMYLHCEGTGSPTVLLSGGFGERSSSWAWVVPAVAQDTRVCTYDRAGQGWSSSAGPQDGIALASDLHRLLQVAGVPGPYLLAGHSVGGVYDLIFAARYPNETAGMVLLDSATPDQFALPTYPGFYAMWRRAAGLLPSLARLGVTRATSGTSFGGLPAQARKEERAFDSDPSNKRGERDEWAQLPTAFDQAKALRSFGTKPLIVITARKDAQAGWLPAQDQLATLSTNSAHRTIDSASHGDLLEVQRFAAISSQAIGDVVTAVRSGAPVKA